MTYRRWLAVETAREIAGLILFAAACGSIVYGIAFVAERIGR